MGARIRKITVSDYTLREMGESGSSRLLFKEKLAIALGIDRYGADVIELPEVSSGPSPSPCAGPRLQFLSEEAPRMLRWLPSASEAPCVRA